jgi:uncharacterized membrane protein
MHGMGKGRLEAFSDGVIAIIITIMVLELAKPASASFAALVSILPHIGIYALSFVYVGIYWNNHHHLFHAVKGVNGAILWANLHLLFWLSLTPFTSAWMGESDFAAVPVGLYGFVLMMCAAAYSVLVRLLIHHDGRESLVARAIGNDFKGWISLVGYIAGIACAPFQPMVSVGLYAAVALIWLIPDPRIERIVDHS